MSNSSLLNDTVVTNFASAASTQSFNMAKTTRITAQHTLVDQTPAAESFDSLAYAAKTIQNVVYTAVPSGVAGNAISVAYTTGGTAGSEVVTAIGNAINVQIHTGVSTATQIVTAITNSRNTAAAKTIQNVVYTAVTAGSAGNSITVAYSTGAVAGSEVVTVSGNAINVQIHTGVSTATQIVTAITASLAASALLTATTSSGSSTQTAPVSATNLIGGTDNVTGLVTATTASGSSTQTAPVSATLLVGGENDAVNQIAMTVSLPSTLFVTGLTGQLTTTGTLPTGLTTSTNYYIILEDANDVAFASSLANALAGTKISLTGDGSGVHTFTPTVLGTVTAQLLISNDGINFVNDGSAATLSTSAPMWTNDLACGAGFAKVSFSITAGYAQVSSTVVSKL